VYSKQTYNFVHAQNASAVRLTASHHGTADSDLIGNKKKLDSNTHLPTFCPEITGETD
jgi:hypothetical protein